MNTSVLRSVHPGLRLCLLGAALFLPSILEAQSRTLPVVPGQVNNRLEIGPVEGLTTVWHPAPTASAMPLGARVRFRVRVGAAAEVAWTGAREVQRDPVWSIAEGSFDTAGPQSISVVLDDHGTRITEGMELEVIALHPTTPTSVGVTVGAIHLTAAPVAIDPADPNGSGTRILDSLGSVAALRQEADGRYVTSINRQITLEAETHPAAFSSLVEWRLDGKPQEHLGSPVLLELFTAQSHVLAGGPPSNELEVPIDTYQVRITSHGPWDEIPDDVPVTFTAVTEPPGHEADITWLAATLAGTAEPGTGQGPEITVTFHDTVGSERRRLGVIADDTTTFGRETPGSGAPCQRDEDSKACNDCLRGCLEQELFVDLPACGPEPSRLDIYDGKVTASYLDCSFAAFRKARNCKQQTCGAT